MEFESETGSPKTRGKHCSMHLIARHSEEQEITPWSPSYWAVGSAVLNSQPSRSGTFNGERHWVFADLIGKGGHVRTVPVPDWVGSAIQGWLAAAAVTAGPMFRAINKAGRG